MDKIIKLSESMIKHWTKKIVLNKEQKIYVLTLTTIIISIFLIKLTVEKADFSKLESVDSFVQHKDFNTTKEFLLEKIISPYIHVDYELKSGDTIKKILKKYKVNNKEIDKAIQLITLYANPNKIQTGSMMTIIIKKNPSEKSNNLEEMIIPVTKTINIKVNKDQDGELVADKIITKLFKKIALNEGVIKKSLYSAAINSKVDPNTIIEFARIYGFEIDFQRDIRKNDRFKILYEKFFDENGGFVKNGSILYAYMSANNREITLYKFGTDKNFGYFDMNGKSIEKALMKTPINGARLSSPFGMRKHPISGFNKMHQGTDFAAPMGTPIMASGTGTVVLAKWCGGGGNCIKIKHNSTYSTVYAHLSKFSKSIRVGKKVRQGQIIGYVGSTGNSTGPHLHYEVIINGKRVNSQTLKLPSGKILKDKKREEFEIHRIKTDVLISEIIDKKN